jgi:hypothetical protein
VRFCRTRTSPVLASTNIRNPSRRERVMNSICQHRLLVHLSGTPGRCARTGQNHGWTESWLDRIMVGQNHGWAESWLGRIMAGQNHISLPVKIRSDVNLPNRRYHFGWQIAECLSGTAGTAPARPAVIDGMGLTSDACFGQNGRVPCSSRSQTRPEGSNLKIGLLFFVRLAHDPDFDLFVDDE